MKPAVRKQTKYVPLSKEEFRKRFYARFYDPAFDRVATELGTVFETAWDGYIKSRKSPRQVLAGPDFADPSQKLPVEWLDTRARIHAAEARQKDPQAPSRILIVNGSTRSEHTCPGEMSKSYRLVEVAREIFAASRTVDIQILDLSRLASEYGRRIHPC